MERIWAEMQEKGGEHLQKPTSEDEIVQSNNALSESIKSKKRNNKIFSQNPDISA